MFSGNYSIYGILNLLILDFVLLDFGHFAQVIIANHISGILLIFLMQRLAVGGKHSYTLVKQFQGVKLLSCLQDLHFF